MGGRGDEEVCWGTKNFTPFLLGYEKLFLYFVGVRKILLHCWGMKNISALLGYEKFLIISS